MVKKKFPSWGDVGLWNTMETFIAELQHDYYLDAIVSDRIFSRKMSLVYDLVCGSCGTAFPERTYYENALNCYICNNSYVRSRPRIERQDPECFTFDMICQKMKSLHDSYVKEDCGEVFRLGWDGVFKAKFMGGSRMSGETAILAGIRSALACPFIWSKGLCFSHILQFWCHNGKSFD